MTVTITYASGRTTGIAQELLQLLRKIAAALRAAGKWFFDTLEEAERYAPYWYFMDHPYR